MQAMYGVTSFSDRIYVVSQCAKKTKENVHSSLCLGICENTPI